HSCVPGLAQKDNSDSSRRPTSRLNLQKMPLIASVSLSAELPLFQRVGIWWDTQTSHAIIRLFAACLPPGTHCSTTLFRGCSAQRELTERGCSSGSDWRLPPPPPATVAQARCILFVHGRIEPPGTIAVCVVAGMVEQVIENAWRDPIGVVRLPHDIWDS